MAMTARKVVTGEFDVLWNGEPTPYSIVNGSLGLSGRDTRNHYGIAGNGKVSWIGSLAKCKKTVAFWLSKK